MGAEGSVDRKLTMEPGGVLGLKKERGLGFMVEGESGTRMAKAYAHLRGKKNRHLVLLYWREKKQVL